MQGLLNGGLGSSGEDVVVGLRPSKADDPSEGAHELILELKLLLGSGTCAAPVEDEEGVLDLSGSSYGIEAFGYAF